MKMKRWILGGAVVGIGVLVWSLFGAPAVTAQQASAWTPTIATIASPAGASSGEPQLTVSDRGVLLSWIVRDGSKMTLRFAERTPTGWTDARVVPRATTGPSTRWTCRQSCGSPMEQGQAYVAFSRDAGRTFGTPIRLDEGGSLGRVDVQMLPDESALATWIEFGDGRAQFRVRRVTLDGALSAPVTIAGLAASRTSGYPRVARHGDEIVFAWTETEKGTSQVRTAVARLPRTLSR